MSEFKIIDAGKRFDTPISESEQNRIKSGLSLEWFRYPRCDIEVFYDSCAVLYRIDGKIYVVPRVRDAFRSSDA